jgi:hypothetical protein
MKYPFTPSVQYTAIALAYRNLDLIADQVLPRMPVNERTFKWDLRTKADLFTVPDTRVGRKGSPSEVEFTSTESESSVADYGLDDVVPIEDVQAAQSKPGLDPLGRAVEGITELIMLGREKRVADLVFAAGTYPAANKVQLSGADQWSHASGDPVDDILGAIDGMLVKPNIMVIGSAVLYQLRKNTKILAAAYPAGGNAASGGLASVQMLQDLFEVRILVGSARINTAKPGQTASLSRCWGKHAALLHVNPLAGLRGNGISFGGTAEWGTRIAGTMEEPKIGLRGAIRARAGESLKELITASDCGYFFEDAVA